MKSSTLLPGRRILVACAVAGVTAFSASAYAALQSFTASDGSATADFTPGSGTVHLVLTDNLGLPNSLADLLSDISFSISGGGAISAVTTSGSPVTCIDGSGCSQTGSVSNWRFSGGSGSYRLNSLDGGPSGMIAPANMLSLNCSPTKCPDGLGGTAGNLGNGQPFLLHSATFDITIANVTSASTISDVSFSFGTGPETIVGVPIPAAAWLFGSGLLGLIGIARRRMGVSHSLAAA